jgi:4-carboxymuconolactone decarboxylase
MAGSMQNSAMSALALISVLVSSNLHGQTMPLPKDIDPVTRSRLPLVEKGSLDAEGRRIYELVAGSPEGAIPVSGPGSVSMYSPKVAEGMHIINSYLRSEDTVLGPRLTEVAILVAAWEFGQKYEWTFHEQAARQRGIPAVVIDTIKYDRDIENLGREETLIIRYGRQVLRRHELSPELWAEAVELFGQRGAFEIAAVIGDYIMAAVMLDATDQHLPEGREASLPER